jgi:hypothetical protein
VRRQEDGDAGEAPITDAIRQDIRDREFLDLCETRSGGRWILSPAKVPQDLQTDQAMRHLMSNFARRAEEKHATTESSSAMSSI